MMTRTVLSLFLLLIAALFTGCDIRYFSTGQNGEIDGRVLTRPYQGVSAAPRSFVLSPGSGVALEFSDRTEYRIEVFAKSLGNDGVLDLGLRSKVEEELVLDSGIVASVSPTASRISYRGETIGAGPGGLPKDCPMIIGLYSDDHYLRINVGCDTIVQRHFEQLESDNLTLFNRGTSPIEIVGVVWKALR